MGSLVGPELGIEGAFDAWQETQGVRMQGHLEGSWADPEVSWVADRDLEDRGDHADRWG